MARYRVNPNANGSNTIHSGFGIPCHNPLHYI